MLDELLSKCKKASAQLALLSADERKKLLINIKDALLKNVDFLLKENQKDIIVAKENGTSKAMIDRLTLSNTRINDIASSIDQIIDLPEVVNIELETYHRPNGLRIVKESVPFGVIGVIFEARPNVSVDITTLCIKTANAVVLKGGKEAINSNKALVKVMREAIKDIINPNIITLIEDVDRATTLELIGKKEYIDLLIPRGGKGLINFVISNAKIPYIETGAGNCSLYVDKDCSLDMALNIALNAKTSRPSVCNAIENIIVHQDIAQSFLPKLYELFSAHHVEMRGDERVRKIIDHICEANEQDYFTEYNDYIVAIKIVDHLSEAISFINAHSTKHSETIVTNDINRANKFLAEIDSACVYHNASTRFSDGGEFGFGAEIGISTQKMHARGPMGLKEITSYKYKIYGDGQIR